MEQQLFIVENSDNLRQVCARDLSYGLLYVISTFGPENITRVPESYNTGKYIGNTIDNKATFNIGFCFQKQFKTVGTNFYYFYTYYPNQEATNYTEDV